MLQHVLQLPVCMTVQDEKKIWHFTHNYYSTLILERNKITYFSPEEGKYYLTFKRRIKSHLPFAGIIRSSPYSPCFQDKG